MRRLARSYLAMDAGHSYVPRFNGEERVIRILGAAGARRVFDVGANVGNWTDLVLDHIADADVHAFEIVPEVAEALSRRFAGRASVTVNRFGLDEHPGEVVVRFYPSFSEGSGVVAGLAVDIPHELRKAEVTTGNAYCGQRGLDHIDFLKLDVEGLEARVLRGFDMLLRAQAIDVIQFEYGLANIESHALLVDYWRMFDAAGYDVGKIFPNHVDFRPYDRRVDEDFRGPNFLAVSRARPDLRARLAGSAPPADLPKAPGPRPVPLRT